MNKRIKGGLKGLLIATSLIIGTFIGSMAVIFSYLLDHFFTKDTSLVICCLFWFLTIMFGIGCMAGDEL